MLYLKPNFDALSVKLVEARKHGQLLVFFVEIVTDIARAAVLVLVIGKATKLKRRQTFEFLLAHTFSDCVQFV